MWFRSNERVQMNPPDRVTYVFSILAAAASERSEASFIFRMYSHRQKQSLKLWLWNRLPEVLVPCHPFLKCARAGQPVFAFRLEARATEYFGFGLTWNIGPKRDNVHT